MKRKFYIGSETMNIKFKKNRNCFIGIRWSAFPSYRNELPHIFGCNSSYPQRSVPIDGGTGLVTQGGVQVEEFTECQNCFDLFEKPIKHAYGMPCITNIHSLMERISRGKPSLLSSIIIKACQ